jgi:hypothetical protein
MSEEKPIEGKLKLMSNFDSDQQFIAACDLSDFVEKHSHRIPEVTLARIIDSLLEHLKSEIIDVHGTLLPLLRQLNQMPFKDYHQATRPAVQAHFRNHGQERNQSIS